MKDSRNTATYILNPFGLDSLPRLLEEGEEHLSNGGPFFRLRCQQEQHLARLVMNHLSNLQILRRHKTQG